ncbi:hypothetical protein [Oribacterium sp. P6A1]|uniref:hypothetical protein n=1 Tax=Oribacterium sp. P6A1 TaxID=1410612 RepID=UPI00056C6651|nr:hypothetical protein [Oribacterium sp. P6A1]
MDSNGDPLYHHSWDGTDLISETEYKNLLNTFYDTQKAISPFDDVKYIDGRHIGNGLCINEEIIEAINSY